MKNQQHDDEIVDIQPPSQDDEITDIQAPKSDSDLLESAKDFGIGAGHGLLMGGADELMGALGAGAETALGKLGIGPSAVDEELAKKGFTGDVGESFLDKYRGYQQAIEKQQLDAQERSPIANTTGQIGGGILGSIALGGAAGLNKAALQGPKALFSETVKNQGLGKAAIDLLRGTATTGHRVIDAGVKGLNMYAKASPYIATESALTSEHQLLGDKANPEGVLSDIGNGQLLGAGTLLGLSAIPEAASVAKGKIGEKIDKVKSKIGEAFESENNPKLRQIAKSYEHYGKELGISPRSAAQEIKRGAEITPEAARDILDGRLGLGPKVDPSSVQIKGDNVAYSLKDGIAADKLQKGIDSIDDILGKKTGESINNSTATINVDPIIQNAANEIQQIVTQYPRLAKNRKSAKAYENILSGNTTLSARQVKDLVDDLDYNIGVFKRSTDLDPGEKEILPELLDLRTELSQILKKNVPEYRAQSEQFESWRGVIEQLVAGAGDPKKSEIYYGSLNKGDKKVQESILKLIEDASVTSHSSSKDRTAFNKFMNKLAEFEALDSERANRGLQKVAPSTEDIRKFILDASDDANLRQSVRRTSESRSILPNWKEGLIGKAPESGAYFAGKAMKSAQQIAQKPLINKTAAMTKAVYKAPAQAISNLASKLETTGNFKELGKALRESVENGDSAKKNAALFTIMQNPNARAFISAEDFPDAEGQE